MRFTFVVSSVEIIDATWTTMHLAHAALRGGHRVRITEPHAFEVTSAGRLVTRAWILDDPTLERDELTLLLSKGKLPFRHVELGPEDTLLLRVNPLSLPMLNIALVAQDLGVSVINDPAGVARTRSKAWLATLQGVPRPATLVTSSRASVHHFSQAFGKPVIIKPASSSGGRGVQLVASGRWNALDDALDDARFEAGGGHVVAQEYLPAAAEGEKRLVWVCGQILGGYLRERGPGEFRHNLRNGGLPRPCEVDAADLAIAAAVGPHLHRNGIRIAGLDVIGGCLVEVNTLNPGGIHYAEATTACPAGGMAAEAIRLLTEGGTAPRSDDLNGDPHPSSQTTTGSVGGFSG